MSAQLSLDDIAVDARLADAVAWKDANELAYRQIVEWAAFDQDNGVRPSIDLYFNLLRRPHFARLLGVRSMDGVVLANNNLRSQVARLVATEHPRFADKKRGFEFRKATSDGWMAVNARPVVPRP